MSSLMEKLKPGFYKAEKDGYCGAAFHLNDLELMENSAGFTLECFGGFYGGATPNDNGIDWHLKFKDKVYFLASNLLCSNLVEITEDEYKDLLVDKYVEFLNKYITEIKKANIFSSNIQYTCANYSLIQCVGLDKLNNVVDFIMDKNLDSVTKQEVLSII